MLNLECKLFSQNPPFFVLPNITTYPLERWKARAVAKQQQIICKTSLQSKTEPQPTPPHPFFMDTDNAQHGLYPNKQKSAPLSLQNK